MDEVSLRQDLQRRDYRFTILLLLASGAAAMGHESLWTRRLADLLGANIESSMRVLGSFFLGISLGAACTARMLPKIRRPWKTLGFLEFGIGLLSIPAVMIPEWTEVIWPQVGPEMLITWRGSLLKLALSMITVLPPSFLIGAVLPVITSTVGRTAQNPYPELWLYAAYTVGGVIGLVLLGASLIRLAGAQGSMALMVLINFLVASVCFRRDRQYQSVEIGSTETCRQEESSTFFRINRIVLGLSFASGFGTIALEVICLELILLAAPLSFFPQIAILLAVIILLAASTTGAALIMPRVNVKPERLLQIVMGVSALSIALVPFLFALMSATQVGNFGYGTSVPEFFFKFSSVILLILAPAFLPAGFVFPVLASWVGSASGRDCRTSSRFAQLLAFNGLGGLFGAEAAYFLLLPYFGVNVSAGLIGVAYGCAALGLSLLTVCTPWRAILATATALGAAFMTFFPLARLPLMLEPENLKILEVWPGSEGTLAIVENQPIGRALIFNTQYLLGGTAVRGDMERQSHIPLLLHPNPKRVAFIGLGTGITAGGSLLHQPVESVTALELSPLVAKAAGTFFKEFNHGVCQDPRARVLVEDARTFLASCHNEYDVIIGDMFIPWRPGEARISTLEQFRSAHRALRSGGVFCQWFPMHQLTPEQFDLIAWTFSQAFDHVYLFRNHLKAQSLPLALIGFKDREMDWNIVKSRCEAERNLGNLRDPAMRHIEGMGLLYLGKVQNLSVNRPPVNTLMNMRLELAASLHFVAGNPDSCFSGEGENWMNFLHSRIQQLSIDQNLPADIQSLPKVGLLAARLEVALLISHPASEALNRQLMAQLPQTLCCDTNADWSYWLGTRPHRGNSATKP